MPGGSGRARRDLRSRLDFALEPEDDARVHERPSAAPRSAGYVIVLVGVAGFVVSCFLPWAEVIGGNLAPDSLYRLVVRTEGSFAEQLGGFLYLFAGAATIGLIAIIGVVGGRRWTPVALAAVAVAWSLTWVGTLLYQSGFFTPHRSGYWSLLISVLVVALGTIVVWASPRRVRGRSSSGD